MEKLHKNAKYRLFMFIFLALLGLVLLYPFYYAIMGSLNNRVEFMESNILPIPSNMFKNIVNYADVFKQSALINSVLITLLRIGVTFFFQATTAVFGGYVFAKLNFPFKRAMFMILLSTMMVPGTAMLVPNFIWMSKFPLIGGNNLLGEGGRGFVDNPLLYFLTGWVSVYNIFLFRQAFKSFGNELSDSAKIDGCGFVRIVLSISLPLVKALIIVVFINTFIGMWNDYASVIVLMPTNVKWHTVGVISIGLAEEYASTKYSSVPDYPRAFAIHVLMMIVPIVLFTCLQKQFVAGMTAGAVKG